MKAIRVRAGLLVDGTGAPPLRDGAILIRGDRIAAVGLAQTVPLPNDTRDLHFPHLTLMPGLVDCHAHLNMPGDGTTVEQTCQETDEILLLRSAKNAETALMSGVTTLRDNGAARRTAFSLKEALRRRIIRGPRTFICGRPVTMTGGHCWPMGGEADGVEGVRRAVRQLLKEGADYVKVMATGGTTLNTDPYRTSYTAEELQSVAAETHAWGRHVVAHVRCTAAILDSLAAGIDVIAHCSFYAPGGRYAFKAEIARRIADAGVIVNPTMHINRTRMLLLNRLAEERPLTDRELEKLRTEQQRYIERKDYFQGLLAAGIPFAAGSDCGWSLYPFGAFHLEAEAMVDAGMSRADAVVAATLHSARSLGIDREVGSLEVGKLADLLLVDGDPTSDISSLGRVDGVFLGGEQVR